MTPTQFFDALEETPRTWEISRYGQILTAGGLTSGSLCPVLAVAFPGLSLSTLPVKDPRLGERVNAWDARALLGLSRGFALDVNAAGVLRRMHRPAVREIRFRLLHSCDLVPEHWRIH